MKKFANHVKIKTVRGPLETDFYAVEVAGDYLIFKWSPELQIFSLGADRYVLAETRKSWDRFIVSYPGGGREDDSPKNIVNAFVRYLNKR